MLQMKKYRKRAHFTEAEKVTIWDRWQQADSLHARHPPLTTVKGSKG
jgi:hypothetical protein